MYVNYLKKLNGKYVEKSMGKSKEKLKRLSKKIDFTLRIFPLIQERTKLEHIANKSVTTDAYKDYKAIFTWLCCTKQQNKEKLPQLVLKYLQETVAITKN